MLSHPSPEGWWDFCLLENPNALNYFIAGLMREKIHRPTLLEFGVGGWFVLKCTQEFLVVGHWSCFGSDYLWARSHVAVANGLRSMGFPGSSGIPRIHGAPGGSQGGMPKGPKSLIGTRVGVVASAVSVLVRVMVLTS